MRRLPLLLLITLALPTLPAAARDYICFGDSITYGSGGNSGAYLGDLAGLLRPTVPDANMENRGVGGENTELGVDRIDDELRGHPAGSVVLIMEGTNDLYLWEDSLLDPSDTRDNLRDMLDTVAARGMTAVLATVPPRIFDGLDPDNDLTRELNGIIRSVASSRGVAVAEVFEQVEPYLSRTIYRDSLHPNELGYTLVAEAFAQALLGGPTPDITGPLPVGAEPDRNETNVPLDTPVELEMKDLGSGINTTTAIFRIDGVIVTPTLTFPSAGKVTFTHRFGAPLNFAQTVHVSIEVDDNHVPPNHTDYSYSFRALDGNGTGGDVDGSGRIDGVDVAVLASAFGSKRRDPNYQYVADIDGNGVVDGIDLSVVASAFGGRP